MSTVNYDHSFDTSRIDVSSAISGSRRQPSRPLHRISEVRQQQGASLRSVSRRLDMTVQEIRDQENACTDLRISELLKWQEILEVPLADLLIDSGGPLSDPVSRRAARHGLARNRRQAGRHRVGRGDGGEPGRQFRCRAAVWGCPRRRSQDPVIVGCDRVQVPVGHGWHVRQRWLRAPGVAGRRISGARGG